MVIRRSLLVPAAFLAVLHGYIGWRILPDLPGGPLSQIIGAGTLVASCGLMLLWMAGMVQPGPRSERVAAIAFFAAAFTSPLLVLTVLREVLLLVAWLLLPATQFLRFGRLSSLAVIGLAVLATGVGFVYARRRARIVRVDIPLPDLPEPLNGFSIAQISDVHVGATIKRRYVEAIVDAVNSLDADMVAVTGDIVDGSVQDLGPHTEPLARLRSRHGAFFVTGNHEYYSGASAWIAEFRRLGLKVLLNEHVIVMHRGKPIVVAGVTDYGSHHMGDGHRSDPAAAIAGAPPTAAKILLAHQPRSATAAAAAGFDLQLSGHTHGGQFWPWNLFVRLQQPFTAGLHRLNRLWVYVSRGTGYWGPPNRIGVPSEITLLRLVRALA